MSACIVCANPSFHELFLRDTAGLANGMIQGLLLPMSSKGVLENFKPQRRGTCLVERCAQTVEAACGSCREAGCPRCSIAAELRAAEARLNAERDTEISELGVDIEGLLNDMITQFCTVHVALGRELAGQWYGRRSFQVSAAADGAPR